MTSTLYFILGMELFVIHLSWLSCLAAAVAVPIVLIGRLISVAIPVFCFSLKTRVRKGLVVILTWGGLRGGLSVAMLLSLPHFADKELLLSCTYAVVMFSVLVQGMTMKPLLLYFKVNQPVPALATQLKTAPYLRTRSAP
jgi:CPA1 family monovalent cation:H+ antiporter